LTIQQAADLIGLPYSSVRDLLLRGTLPRVEIPGFRRLMVDRRDLERTLENWKTRDAE
jgi:excisionase family DNA binding protein